MLDADNATEVAEATEQILTDVAERDAGADWDVAAWEALAGAGLTLVEVPESAGGGGGTLREAAEVVRVAGAFAVRVPVAETALAGWLLARCGLPVPTGVLTVAGPGITAEPAGDGGWALAGTARWVPYGRLAETVVVVADTMDGRVVLAVDPAAAAVTAGNDLAGDPRDDLDLGGVVVPASSAAPLPDGAREEFALRAALGRLLLCAGAGQTVLTLTLRYVGEREQFGRPIGRFQAVQHLVAELAGEVAAIQIGTDAAVLGVGSGAPTAWLAVAAGKADADRSINRITAIAHQLHGAIGATHEHALQRFTLRLWSWREEGGPATGWAGAIAARALAPDAAPLWQQIVG